MCPAYGGGGRYTEESYLSLKQSLIGLLILCVLVVMSVVLVVVPLVTRHHQQHKQGIPIYLLMSSLHNYRGIYCVFRSLHLPGVGASIHALGPS